MAKKYELHLEAMGSFAGSSLTSDFLFVRPGVRRIIVGQLSTMLTYSYFERYPADSGAQSNLQEHRFSQDLQWSHGLLRSQIAHRFRYEERLRSSNSAVQQKTWSFSQRARYRLGTEVPAPWRTNRKWPAYLTFYDEVFLHTARPQGGGGFDQNQSGAGVGWRLRTGVDLEAGYIHVYSADPRGAIGIHHHLLRLTLLSRLPFRRDR